MEPHGEHPALPASGRGRRRFEGLEARFKGAPKRRKPTKKVGKGSAKRSATAKRSKGKAPSVADSTAKKPAKQRLRDRKNIGKRRKPSGATGAKPDAGQGVEAGFEPPKRRA
jgi:ATP-dependent RNA helicase SrmB